MVRTVRQMQTVSGPGIPYGTGLAPKAAQTMPLQNRVDPFGDIFATPADDDLGAGDDDFDVPSFLR